MSNNSYNVSDDVPNLSVTDQAENFKRWLGELRTRVTQSGAADASFLTTVDSVESEVTTRANTLNDLEARARSGDTSPEVMDRLREPRFRIGLSPCTHSTMDGSDILADTLATEAMVDGSAPAAIQDGGSAIDVGQATSRIMGYCVSALTMLCETLEMAQIKAAGLAPQGDSPAPQGDPPAMKRVHPAAIQGGLLAQQMFNVGGFRSWQARMATLPSGGQNGRAKNYRTVQPPLTPKNGPISHHHQSDH